MNPFRKLRYRLFQKALYIGSFFLDFRLKDTYEGEAGLEAVIKRMRALHFVRPFVLADPGVLSSGAATSLITKFSYAFPGDVVIFDEVRPNPTFATVDDAVARYSRSRCDCIIAIGGGSCLDTAKLMGVKLAYPNKSLERFKGILHVHRRLVPMLAVPTTAGTGSEATLAAVIINEKTKDKFQIDDPKLRPSAILFYPRSLTALPKPIIAGPGMDALTHLVEAFIGKSNTYKTKEHALLALRLIHENLLSFYENPMQEKVALEMLKASYHAGLAFTRAYVGYVHALAHALGGVYNVPHGLANAILLPIVLRAYGKKVHRKLAYLADEIQLTPGDYSKEEKAAAFIAYIENLNSQMGIPRQFDHLIQEKDLAALAAHAEKEANPLYPVPRIFDAKDLLNILKRSDTTWGVI